MKNNYQIKEDIVEIECKRNNGDIVVTKIDIVDFDLVNEIQTTWYVHVDNKNHKMYVRGHSKDENGEKKVLLLHRVLTDCPEGLVVNHLSGNSLDNTRENLEVTTHTENVIHGKQLVEVFVRRSKKLKSWYDVVWVIDNEIEILASTHLRKNEALIRKMIVEIRQRPDLLDYVDYTEKFKELGYDWSLVPFEKLFGDMVPKLLIGKEIRQLEIKGGQRK